MILPALINTYNGNILNNHVVMDIWNFSGGGSLGCQTQYHLAKLGITNTVLLEKDRLTAGT